MARPTGTCKPCLKTKLLERSHLMPRSLYAYCRGTDGLDPIMFTSDVVLPTARQTQDYLLCGDCEDLLNKGGETWITSKLATYEKTFRLYDLVVSGPVLVSEHDWRVYCGARNPNIEVDKIIHFAMGLFWKASVHPWRGDRNEPRINLGPYSEEIRRFLNGDCFPANIALAVALSPPGLAYIGFNDPYEAARDLHRNFMLFVPGMWFMLSVGKTLSSETRALCIASNPDNPIMISPSIARKGLEAAYHVFKNARKTNKFHEAMKKVKRVRGH